jgi:protein gp37
MGTDSKIEWTDHTWNPWIGCEKVSAGCKNCYAEKETFARVSRGKGKELWGANAARHLTTSTRRDPHAWASAAIDAGERRRVFCLSLGDFFESRNDLRGPRAAAYRTMAGTADALDYLVLTKRPQNAARLLGQAHADNLPLVERLPIWLNNIVLGATVEDQEAAATRIPVLRQLKHDGLRRSFLSVEPLLGPVDLSLLHAVALAECLCGHGHGFSRCPDTGGIADTCDRCSCKVFRRKREHDAGGALYDGVDWVIVGGESGPKARPFQIAWARSIVEQCKRARVPVFVKQMGSNAWDGERRLTFQHSKGGDMSEWPEDLRVRQLYAGLPHAWRSWEKTPEALPVVDPR